MTELAEKLHAGGFAVSQANGNRSRENAILASGSNLLAGTVLGKTATSGVIAGAAGAGNTVSSGGISALSIGGGAKPGIYKAICIEPAANAGTFELFDPSGVNCGRVTVAVAFTGVINFTIADATDFVAGDYFDITVSQLVYKYKQLAPAATDGTQNAAAVLFADTDATSADKACVVVARDCEVNNNELTWPIGITAAQKDVAIAQLQSVAVMVR